MPKKEKEEIEEIDLLEPELEPEPEVKPALEVKSQKPVLMAIRTFKESGKIFKAGVIYTGKFPKKFLKIGFLRQQDK